METSTVRPKNQDQFHNWVAVNVPKLEGRMFEWLFIRQILKWTIPLTHKSISIILSSNSHVSIFSSLEDPGQFHQRLWHTQCGVTQEDPDLLTVTVSWKFLLFSAFGKQTKHSFDKTLPMQRIRVHFTEIFLYYNVDQGLTHNEIRHTDLACMSLEVAVVHLTQSSKPAPVRNERSCFFFLIA
jgi:hypothetical protein